MPQLGTFIADIERTRIYKASNILSFGGN